MTVIPVEQLRPEMEEGAEVGLKATIMVDMSPSNGSAAIVTGPIKVANGDGESSDKNGDPGASCDLDISDILDFEAANFDGNTNGKNETLHESIARQVETGESSGVFKEVVEEEIVELEFEKVKPKLATHTMHCPNCKSEVTKVILRRRVITIPRTVEQTPNLGEQTPNLDNLVGCFSCFSLFTCSDNGCFNPFDIFRKRPYTSNNPASQLADNKGTKPVVHEKENCLSMFWVLKKKQVDTVTEDPPQTDPRYDTPRSTSPDPLQTRKYVTGNTSTEKENTADVDNSDGARNELIGASGVPFTSNDAGDLDTRLDVVTEPGNGKKRAATEEEGSASLEILKSIVYGGLMEVIASLSVVASAAASDATTLSIVALALASLIGGIFVIGHNLWDLRDDYYKGDSTPETNREASNKYKELLGRIDYFPLHAVFAILSFLIFGMIPPVAYGFSFRETNDKDYTIVVVAIASLLCVSLLAIFKAYINRCTGFFAYVKTLVYYITTAVSVSGVSYVAGNLVTRLMEELGLFDTSSGGAMSLLPHATTPSLGSF